MSKTEIIEELAHLSAEDLAEIKAWLDRASLGNSTVAIDIATTTTPRLRTPRLSDSSRAGDFVKKVTELSADASF